MKNSLRFTKNKNNPKIINSNLNEYIIVLNLIGLNLVSYQIIFDQSEVIAK